jgi:hypothetical protein
VPLLEAVFFKFITLLAIANPIEAVGRVMGIVVAAIAVQLIVDGIEELLPTFASPDSVPVRQGRVKAKTVFPAARLPRAWTSEAIAMYSRPPMR